MARRIFRETLPPYKKARLPPFPGMIATLGPGVIFMALAQGSGELIWWPYIIAKYGLTFLFLLIWGQHWGQLQITMEQLPPCH